MPDEDFFFNTCHHEKRRESNKTETMSQIDEVTKFETRNVNFFFSAPGNQPVHEDVNKSSVGGCKNM